MSDSQVAESSRTASVRETLIDLRATKLATTNGVKSQTTTTTSVSVPQSSQKTAVSGFDGEDFVRFSDVDLSTDMPHEEPFAPPAAVAGKKRSAHDMENGYLNKKQETDANSRHCPWALHVDWQSCTNPAQMLHKEVQAFVEYMSPTPIEHETRTMVIDSIRNAVVGRWPDAKVFAFGSYETMLYLPHGDIDLVIESHSLAGAPRSTLQQLARLFRHYNIATDIQVIASAKVPIIKFISSYGRFSVDVSVNQINGVAAGQIVNNFIKHMPALRPLVLVVKMFLNQRSMNEVFSGGLGSYSIVILCASFLKMHPKIRRGEIDPMYNLGVLLVEFFELYGNYFNYDETGISLRDGGSYFSKRRRGWYVHERPYLLSLEDPQDRANDVAAGSRGIVRVRQTLAGAFGMLITTLQARASLLDAKRRRLHHRIKEGSEDPLNMSILGSIMGVTQTVINHRKLVAELYKSGALHHAMGLEPPHQKSDPQRPTNTNATSAKSKSKAKTKKATSKSRPTSSSHSEDSAWDEANFGAEEARTLAHKADTDDEAEGRYGIQDRRNKRAKKSHRHHRHSRDKDGGDESEEEGAVSDEGPQKRGAGGGGRKTWAEYHSDSDSNSDSESEEVEEIVVKPLSSSGKQQEKRAYWKAKGGDGRDDKEKD